METLLQDLHYGLRMLAKSPGFTAVAIIALTLGIGANSAIFSVVNSVLLRSLPYQNADQLVMIWGKLPGHGVDQMGASAPEFMDYREQTQAFEHIAAYYSTSFNLTGGAEPERITATLVSASLFPALGVRPALGRDFLPEEDQHGRGQVAILSHGLWQRRFGSDPAIIGQALTLNGQPYAVIGIMPAGFQFLNPETELWVPVAFTPHQLSEDERGSHWLNVLARLKPGVTLQQARTEMDAIARRIQQQHRKNYSDESGWGVIVEPLHETVVGNVRSSLLILLGVVGFVLLIACANVANLLLARASVRQKEIAIRAALGANRFRLIRQMLTESILLSLIGASLGILLTLWANDLLVALKPQNLPRLAEVGIDSRVLWFTFAVSLLTGALFGLAPALQTSKPNLNESLKEGGRTTGSVGRHRLRSILVISEVALALVLLIGAGLMIKSLYRLQQFSPGFNPANVLTMRLSLPQSKYSQPHHQRAFFESLLKRVETLPGVQSASAVNSLPLSRTGNRRNFSIEGRGDMKLNVEFRMASPDYFRSMGIPLMKGRFFTERDREGAPGVVIVNESLARIFFPEEDPLGKRIKVGSLRGPFPWLSIVGVVGDVKHDGLDAEAPPEMYVSYLQPLLQNFGIPPMFLVVRSADDPLNLIAAVQSEVLALDKNQPVYRVATMDQLVSSSMAERRFQMILFGIFAAIALLLAAIGIYGVISTTVAQRTHEIGIRVALGARSSDVMRLVVGQGMALALIGVAAGLAGALALTRLMSMLLFGVSTTDPATYASIAMLLMIVALLACYIPARRATKVDPMVALRYE